MTAFDLIAQWFGRAQSGVAGNMRYITLAQLDLLRELIGRDEEGSALQPGRGRSFVWTPSGRDKYVITEDPAGGRKHTIMRLANIRASGMGSLF
jgi:hypothetical protein